mgnify:CR=1 FL=1
MEGIGAFRLYNYTEERTSKVRSSAHYLFVTTAVEAVCADFFFG